MPSEVNTAEANWLILYTKPRFEKKVALRLQEIGVAFYLPLHKTLKQWSDRRKWVEEPLFKSYVFVKHEPTRYFDVLNIPGAVKFIHFSGELATIRSSKIHEIKLLLSNFSDVDVVSMEHVEPSDNVRVIAGPLQGLKGKALAYKGKQVLAVEVEHIGQSLVIQLPVKYLEKI